MIPTFITKEKIEKGWSDDLKYRVTDETGIRYLWRVSPTDQYERKREEFILMQQVAALGVPMCQPLDFGLCEEGVWSLQSWIEGIDAEEIFPVLSQENQYAYGLEAGRILRDIHAIPAPTDVPDWESRFNQKADRKIRMYQTCPLKYPYGQVFIDYLNANRHLLHGRPQVFQHGDYHIGNMMINKDGRLYIIDFNRRDFGDPWEEFNRIVWCGQKAPAFAAGMVDGYFHPQSIPADFWALLALYIASNTLSSLPWAIPFGESEVKTMTDQADEIFDWYDGMINVVPKWYREYHS